MRTNMHLIRLLPGLLLLAPVLAAANPGAAAPAPAPAAAPGQPDPHVQLSVPLFGEAFADVPVAQVEDDAITVRDLRESLAMTHSGHKDSAKKKDLAPLVDRLVAARLIVREARDMELDQLPQVKSAVAAWRQNMLRESLKSRAASAVKPDPKDVEAVYKQMVQEWSVRSVLFEKAEDAAAFAKGAKDAATFKAAAASALAAGNAKGKDEPEWVGRARTHQGVVAALLKMKVGEVSAPIQIGNGHAVVLLEDNRYPDVPKAREEAETLVAAPTMQQALRDYYANLVKKHATVDRKVLASVNYRKARLEALEKDKRVLVRIRGEAPVTVADLHGELKNQFFHGLDRAASEGKIDKKKEQILESFLFRRLLDKEAKDQRLADDPAFRRRVAEFERSLLFAAFVDRVIAPDVKVDEGESKAYYDTHQAELKYPDFYKLETLAFREARDAQAACEKLRTGTDVKWLKANADGQLGADERSLQVDGTTVSATSMPEGLASVLSGAGSADCRIWARSSAENYAVHVVERIPSHVQPFEETREGIEKKLLQEKIARSVDDWGRKLRQAHQVNLFVTGIGG